MALDSVDLRVGDEALLAIIAKRGVGDATPAAITPTGQKIQVVDSDGTDVIPETTAGLSGTTVYKMVGSADVTATAGTYTVIWTIEYTVGGNDEVKKFAQTVRVAGLY